MIVAEPYQRDGDPRTYLRDLKRADSVPPGYVNTGLADMPTGFDKIEWDGQRATPPTLTAEEKLDRLPLLPPRVLRALVARAAPSATAAQRAAAGVVLDAALAAIEAARAQAQSARVVGPG